MKDLSHYEDAQFSDELTDDECKELGLVNKPIEELEIGDQDYRWCHKYAHDVVSGKVIAGKWVKLACQRHLGDLERDDVYFDAEAAKSICIVV